MGIIKTLNNHTPRIGDSVFVAENAIVIGDTHIGEHSSVWYGVVIRGDVNTITIGHHSNIQDLTMVHCTYNKASTTIGNYVTIGHSAIVHGCTIGDNVLIGMGARLLDLCVVPENIIIAAGSLVLERTVLESGWLYAGSPVRKIKPLTDEHLKGIRQYADYYEMYAQWYREQGVL
jgi:carbonic anhydrase/acetyltransferase-like protein (isoleucine patch superfamily)